MTLKQLILSGLILTAGTGAALAAADALLAEAVKEANAVEREGDVGDLGNKPERLEWLRDNGFGMFLHWGLDAQLGSVISHSMVGADEAYLDRYINELPRTFYPKHWAADRKQRRAFVIGSVEATEHTEISVVGHNGKVVEYTKMKPDDIAPRFEQKDDGLHLSIVPGQRIPRC